MVETVAVKLLSPLSPRYYSISSSARVQPNACSITVGALIGEARSGNGTYYGTCSNYLVEQHPDRVVNAFVRDTSSSFRLPEDPNIPVVMIASGTGLAPFRGFLQERAANRESGADLAAGLLFFGCRHPQSDELYLGELEELATAANVQLACAYSRVPELPRVYVQDRVRQMGEQEKLREEMRKEERKMRAAYRRGEIDDLLKPENKTERYKELEKKFGDLQWLHAASRLRNVPPAIEEL